MKNILISILFAIAIPAYSQIESLLAKAENCTRRLEYDKALNNYNKALAIDTNSYQANAGKGILLGEFMEHYEEAIPFLEKALNKSTKDTLLTIYYTLGKCYHFLGEYDRALYCYNKLTNYEEIGDPMFSRSLAKNIDDCHYALEHGSNTMTNDIKVKNVGPEINTKESEYAPVLISKDKLIFTSKRKDTKNERINRWDGKYFESMYVSDINGDKYSLPVKYTRPDLEKHTLLSKNESALSISPDASTLFLYRGGDIYTSPMNDNSRKPQKLSKTINMAKYQNHASVSKDNSTMYFSSESIKGYGGTDIYRSVKNKNGEWAEAELLDSTVNTIFNEEAPFISEDGTLYFSSNGHPGYGKYDIYKTTYINGHWTVPENLGQPINSSGDDIFLSLFNNKEGYYSSSRPGGFGDMDIYSISYEKQIKSDSNIKDPELAIKELKEIKRNPGPLRGSSGSNKYLGSKELKNLGWDASPLYFNYNESSLKKDALTILKQDVAVLKKNPKLNIYINGYSDARGSEKYNFNLSLNRAITVKKYLLAQGISANRIKATQGLGETGLINNCGNDAACEESQHQLNRRVEIKILKDKEAGVEISENK